MNHLVITTLCNNNCVTCINNFENRKAIHPLDYYVSKSSEISKEKHVSIGGGEPTIHPEFFDILKLVNSFGKEYTLLTNARAFSNTDFLTKFDNFNLDKGRLRIATALYGSNEEIHDSITKTPGSFIETFKGIQKLLSLGYKVELRIIISKLNLEDMDNISNIIINNFSTIERTAFINLKVTGEAYKSKESVVEKYSTVSKSIEKSIRSLLKVGIVVHLLHFPHCIIKEEFHSLTRGKTINDNQLYFPVQCSACSKKIECSGVWKSYYNFMGDEEFQPI